MARFWVGVASREHVLAAVRGAFCQLNHGKEAPVRRLQMGDSIAFYSPRERMEGGESLQAFTAAGRAGPSDPIRRTLLLLIKVNNPSPPLQ
jgi:EVE domain